MMNEAVKVTPSLKMEFDANDVIDVLVSEQEQDIEKQIESLNVRLEELKDGIKDSDSEIEDYIKNLVDVKFSDKILSIKTVLDSVGANASVGVEIIDGCNLPSRRRRVLTTNTEHEEKSNKIITSLVISNKEFDRSTVDGTITFFLEMDYDERLKEMKTKNEELCEQMRQVTKTKNELETALTKTDRLVRKAKASITKKAIGQDVKEFLEDFKRNQMQEIPQIKGN